MDFKFSTKNSEVVFSYRQWVQKSQNRHLHESYEVLYVVSGRRKMFITGKMYEMKAGEIIIIPPNTIHKSFENQEGSEIYNLYFNPEVTIKNMQLNTVVIPDKQIINLINNIDDEFKIQQENFEQLIKCYCNQIFILYYRGINNQRQYNITSTNTTIVSIIEYINKNYNKDISLNKLSLLYNYSPEYISRLFPIKTGFNLTDYINHVRIKNAKIFLKDKSIKINEVCFLCGFGSLTHFGRVFKSITGYSPSIYKKRAM